MPKKISSALAEATQAIAIDSATSHGCQITGSDSSNAAMPM
jgi:hypothetical protein